MRLIPSLLLLFVGSPSPFYYASAAECAENSTIAVQCLSENRQCVVAVDDSSTESCGDCLEDYVEWNRIFFDETICFNLTQVTWEDFIQDYEPIYNNNLTTTERLDILVTAIRFILEFRQGQLNGTIPTDFELGITPFAADTEEDYFDRSGFIFQDDVDAEAELELFQPIVKSSTTSDSGLPSKVDWVDFGAVTSVKDQGRCGSCWAFSLAAAIEGSVFIQNGYFQSLSTQQYISCDKSNFACDGGSLVSGMSYSAINSFGGLTTLNEYEYTDYRGDATEECLVDDKPLAVKIANPQIAFNTIPIEDYQTRLDLVKGILAEQPVAIAIKSACRTLSMYRKGIMTDDGDCACNDPYCMDHAVLLVGYDDTTDPPSFKIKNSWGEAWGEGGYFRVSQQETDGPYGLFGVMSHGVVAGRVTNTTVQVEDEEQDVPLKPWAWLLIVVACLCVCGVIGKVVMNSISNKDGGETEGPPL